MRADRAGGRAGRGVRVPDGGEHRGPHVQGDPAGPWAGGRGGWAAAAVVGGVPPADRGREGGVIAGREQRRGRGARGDGGDVRGGAHGPLPDSDRRLRSRHPVLPS